MIRPPHSTSTKLSALEGRIGISHPEDWYHLSPTELLKTDDGFGLLSDFGGSLFKALEHHYPEHQWQGWRFENAPLHFWSEEANVWKYMEWLAQQLGVDNIEDWYGITKDQLLAHKGRSILQKHDFSIHYVLCALCPEYPWQPWRFLDQTRTFWDDEDNQHKFMEWLAAELDISALEEWAFVKSLSVEGHGGGPLLDHYKTIGRALAALYPETTWQLWRFDEHLPNGFWDRANNVRAYVEWLGRELRIECAEQWYKVRAEEVIQRGGAGLLKKYDNALIKLLAAAYPECTWQPWKFAKTSKCTLRVSMDTTRAYLEWLARKLQIHKMDDWCDVSVQQVEELKGFPVVGHGIGYSGLVKMLRACYPNHRWRLKDFEYSKKTQSLLARIVKGLLPKDTVIFSDFHHPHLNYEYSAVHVQLDVYVPSLVLALEYQGVQHYQHNSLFGSPREQHIKDAAKKYLCKKAGITLVELPFWNQVDVQSVKACIEKHRPDIPLLEIST